MLTSFTSDEAMLDATGRASGYVVKDIKGMELAKPSRTLVRAPCWTTALPRR
jgi:hypothetical protein